MPKVQSSADRQHNERASPPAPAVTFEVGRLAGGAIAGRSQKWNLTCCLLLLSVRGEASPVEDFGGGEVYNEGAILPSDEQG